jgi:UDP-glucuronate 4-epimerase
MKSLLTQLTASVRNENWPAVSDLAGTFPRESTAQDSREVFLVTGGAGFIGSHLARRLLAEGRRVLVFDDFNDYYDPSLKYENIADLLEQDSFELFEIDVRDGEGMLSSLAGRRIDGIVHLAARAGVRPSVADPQLYVTTNVLGTQNILDIAREHGASSFVYASSSSVYGETGELPFRESQSIDHPISPYAATKRSNEGQAACYAHLYGLPAVGLRFFSVYGPAGRPDMAIRQFVEKLDRKEPIIVFGDGSFERDFTYIDDIVEGVMGAIRYSREHPACCELFNLGESDSTSVRTLVLLIASALELIDPNLNAKSLAPFETERAFASLVDRGLLVKKPEQPGDVHRTFADISKSRAMLGYAPRVSIAEGIRRTVAWHRARKDQTRSSFDSRLADLIRAYSDLRYRSALDRFGRPRHPKYAAGDALSVVRMIERLPPMNGVIADSALTRHLALGLIRLLGVIAASVSSAEAHGDQATGPSDIPR